MFLKFSQFFLWIGPLFSLMYCVTLFVHSAVGWATAPVHVVDWLRTPNILVIVLQLFRRLCCVVVPCCCCSYLHAPAAPTSVAPRWHRLTVSLRPDVVNQVTSLRVARLRLAFAFVRHTTDRLVKNVYLITFCIKHSQAKCTLAVAVCACVCVSVYLTVSLSVPCLSPALRDVTSGEY